MRRGRRCARCARPACTLTLSQQKALTRVVPVLKIPFLFEAAATKCSACAHLVLLGQLVGLATRAQLAGKILPQTPDLSHHFGLSRLTTPHTMTYKHFVYTQIQVCQRIGSVSGMCTRQIF